MTDPEPIAGPIPAPPAEGVRRFPCRQCGADLAFTPGTASLTCAHCGAVNEIDASGAAPVAELDYAAELEALGDRTEQVDAIVSHCESCGADVRFPENVTSTDCPFCGRAVVAQGTSVKLVRPGAILPFGVQERAARDAMRKWIDGLWFAPSDFRRLAAIDARLGGVYVPYWTYDCHADTQYAGKRGDDYWDTEWVTVMVNGRPQRQMRRVRRTRWTSVSGEVSDDFDDVLVCASGSLSEREAATLEPWDVKAVVPFAPEYLAGFRAESYAVALKPGFERAGAIMRPRIESTIRADIGGDHQIIDRVRIRYSDVRFKLVLLPVWVSAYRFRGAVFRTLVNARTGEVIGQRPYSAWKITGLVFAILLALGIGFVLLRVFAR